MGVSRGAGTRHAGGPARRKPATRPDTGPFRAGIGKAYITVGRLGGAEMVLSLDVARATAGLNVVLLLSLVAVWARNYLQFRSKHTLGLLVFALLLFAENGLALYYYFFAPFDIPLPAVEAMMYLQLLEAGAVAFLAWVTMD